MTQELWAPSTRIGWETLCPDEYLPLTQAWRWGEAKTQAGSRVERYVLDHRIGVQLERRRGAAWAAGAPLGELGLDVGGALRHLARQLRTPILVSPVSDTPGLSAPIADGLFLSGTVLVDLRLGDDLLRRRLDKRWRNALSKAERSDTDVVDGTLDELMSLLDRLALKKSFNLPYKEEFLRRLRPSFGRECRIRVARRGGVVVGGWLDLREGSTATYLMGATTEKGRAVNASYLLTWDAIRHHRETARFLDLGGIGVERTTGPSGFKVRTGGRIVDFPGTYLVGSGARALAVDSWLRLKRLRARARGKRTERSEAGAR
jgi:hypothetical protein